MLDKLKALIPYKLKALAVHFSLSLVIFGVLLYIILFHWYPDPWFALDGGWQGVQIVIWVDLVLGPLLTFLVFNPHKTRLALGIDFSFIAIVQLCALVWGIHLVHLQRPLAIVYSIAGVHPGVFHSADTLSLQRQNLDVSALAAFGDHLPVLVYAEHPTSPQGKAEYIKKLFADGVSEYEQVQLFRPMKSHLDQVFSRQHDIGGYAQDSPEMKKSLDKLLAQYPESKWQDFRYVSFEGRYEGATLVFKPDGTLIGTLPLLPEALR